jgi:hypothetical protein
VAAATAAFTGSASGRLPNPCALLRTAEVAKAVGDTIQSRAPGGYDDPHSCTWNGVPYGTFMTSTPTLTLAVAEVTEAQFKRSSIAIVPGAEPGTMGRAQGRLVKHLGDLAYSMPAGADLIVWYRGTMLDLSSNALVSPLESEEALAEIALKRLPASG